MGNCFQGQSSDDVSLLREGGAGAPRESSSLASSGPPDEFMQGQHGGSGGGSYERSHHHEVSVPMGVSSRREAFGIGCPPSNIGVRGAVMTEEEQVKIAKRIGLIQHLPSGVYESSMKAKECVICMIDFANGDPLRFLPCMHTYHTECIDGWLMRALTCPSCLEPVESALLTTYEQR